MFNTVRFLLSGRVLRFDFVLLAQYCIFAAHTSCEGGQKRETVSAIPPPPLRHCRHRLAERNRSVGTPLPVVSGLDAPCRRFLPSATARSRPDLPRLRLACSRPWQTVCHVSRRATQTAPAAEPMKEPYAMASDVAYIHIQSIPSKVFDGMADFQ